MRRLMSLVFSIAADRCDVASARWTPVDSVEITEHHPKTGCLALARNTRLQISLSSPIAAHGLLQNLAVTKKSPTGKTKSKADTYEVYWGRGLREITDSS